MSKTNKNVEAQRPRNYVAKHASVAGRAGAMRDRKRAAKAGAHKHRHQIEGR